MIDGNDLLQFFTGGNVLLQNAEQLIGLLVAVSAHRVWTATAIEGQRKYGDRIATSASKGSIFHIGLLNSLVDECVESVSDVGPEGTNLKHKHANQILTGIHPERGTKCTAPGIRSN